MNFKYSHIVTKRVRLTAYIFMIFLLLTAPHILANDSIKVTVNSAVLDCYNKKGGKLSINIIKGKAPFTYKILKNTSSEILYTGSFTTSEYEIEDIDTGTFIIKVIDATGKAFQEQIVVKVPAKLEAGTISVLKEKRGKGKLMANPHGGTPPYTYQWISQAGVIAHTQIVKKLNNGIYKVQIQDANNCGPEEATIFFTEKTEN